MIQRGQRMNRSLSVAVLSLLLGGLWLLLPDFWAWSRAAQPRTVHTEAELFTSLKSFSPLAPPTFTHEQLRAAQLGRRLFADTRFSATGEVSCATCHQPGREFTDGRPLAIGSAQLTRHTPSLVNSFAASWFFWDGRADSLSAQVQGPVEAPLEHGIDRGRVAQVLWQHYRQEYEELFGLWPDSLKPLFTSSAPLRARPRQALRELDLSLAHYTIATISKTSLQTRWIQSAAAAGLSPQRYLAKNYLAADDPESLAVETYEGLSRDDQLALDRIFARYAWALAQFERGLVARRSPFDSFVARSQAAGSPQLAADFDEDAWRGFRVFMDAGCAQCHSGPLFSNQQFHNIGLDQRLPELDIGRAQGVLQVKADRFNCLYPEYPVPEEKSESCAELDFLREDNTEAVGAFKTPSLRNVARTAPYMHDGRFATLDEVFAHYQNLPGEPAVGHRDETLQPLKLEIDEREDLRAFLRSLTSPIDDLTLSD